MKPNQIEQLALVYGNKELIMEFIEIFEIDRMHDNAPIKAMLVKDGMKQE